MASEGLQFSFASCGVHNAMQYTRLGHHLAFLPNPILRLVTHASLKPFTVRSNFVNCMASEVLLRLEYDSGRDYALQPSTVGCVKVFFDQVMISTYTSSEFLDCFRGALFRGSNLLEQ